MKWNETEFGFEYSNENLICFFGKHNSDIQNLYKAYPYLNWASLKQTHSDQLVECHQASLGYIEADAHWTKVKNLSLIIRTADCIPVLGWNSSTGHVVSIHAGWRGVANQIVKKSIQILSNQNPSHHWHFWVGPHIMKKSFEIKNDTLELLKQATNLNPEEWSEKIDNSIYADLSLVLDSQLQSEGVPSTQIYKCFFDTKSDLRFHSHRRDKELSGRQISFIAKI